jgi:8-oxo-dGTP pyrophosphatase MutT (NUDIX family)
MAISKVFAYVIRTDQDRPRLLVFKSHDEPGFEVPKGRVEPGEDLETAILREVKEETGITQASIIKRLGVTSWNQEEQHFFLLQCTQDMPQSFDHIVTGQGIDVGFRYEYHWVELTEKLHTDLVQGCHRLVGELLQVK